MPAVTQAILMRSAMRHVALCFALAWPTVLLACSSLPATSSEADASCSASSLVEPTEAANVECPNDLPSRDDCGASTLTYQVDTAPLIHERCVGCHQGGTGNRYVFSSYAGVASARAAILAQVYGCRMPPSCAPPLAAGERSVLLKWLVCGAPEG
jgi:hypothetical protein